MTDLRKMFAYRLVQARRIRCMSQADLATKSGLHPAAISHFETGNRMPSIPNLKRLADALNIKTDHLLGRDK